MKNKIYQDFSWADTALKINKENIAGISQNKGIRFIHGCIRKAVQVPENALASHPEMGFDSNMLSVVNSVRDKKTLDRIKKTAAAALKNAEFPQTIIQCGIGGSIIGSSLITGVLGETTRTFIPAASANTYSMHLLKKIIAEDPKKIILIKATRSNKTPETLSTYNLLEHELKKHLPDSFRKHCIHILGKDIVEDEAVKKGYFGIGLEPNMSGRFTVLAAANLTAMSLMGIDIEELAKGGEYMLEKCAKEMDAEENPSLKLALYLYHAASEFGIGNLRNGVWDKRLHGYNALSAQLFNESLRHSPKVIIDSSGEDLPEAAHFNMQAYDQGIVKYFHHFVAAAKYESPEKIPGMDVNTDEFEKALLLGIKKRLEKTSGITPTGKQVPGRPGCITFLKDISASSLGQLIMRDMLIVIYLGGIIGEELGLDYKSNKQWFFQQPGVEGYKLATKELLKNPDNLKNEMMKVNSSF
ncbi:MAG: hypothetical protein KKF44_07075 [Nanoarchaeota archaeon]|nr:hypothetical protein [Nanoarchaeota archaeon]